VIGMLPKDRLKVQGKGSEEPVVVREQDYPS